MRYRTRCLSVLIFCALGLMWLAQAFSQNAAGVGSKTLTVDRPLADDPIRVVKVMEGVTELKWDGHEYPNRYAWEAVFDAGDDWLRDLSFVIKNVSAKPILYVGIGSVLHETGDLVGEIARHANAGTTENAVGQRPQQALYSPTLGRWLKPDRRAPVEVAPGEEITLALENPKEYATLKSRIGSSVTGCNAMVGHIFFEDGTKWEGHNYYRPDPEHPGRWIKISFEEWSEIKGVAD
jgi:hypothetical protein